MKRKGNLFHKITSKENLLASELKARRGKAYQYGVRIFDKNKEYNINQLHEMLISKKYITSEYTTFTVYEPKERLVYRLPYFPDRITHHAIMNVMEPLFTKWFTNDSYSSIKGKGIHNAAENLKESLKDKDNTTYCLKLDIVKFYPNVNHEILKQLLRKKIKDQDLLWLLDEIIESSEGLPIGNYLSQYFANFYLTFFDHWIKENLKIKYYFRYADDIIILSKSKSHLHEVRFLIKQYLNEILKLKIKDNYQVFPVETRGIDFVGYVFFHTHVLLRKSIKKRFAKAVSKNASQQTIAAYNGWTKHCNAKHLLKKLLLNDKI
jgi:RNA-directed DNA polymerase